MTTAYSPLLKLALPVQGELSGTWGDTVNDNITSMIEEAVAGRATINTWTTNSHTLTTANGTTAESRAAMLSLTDSGTALTGAGSVICPALSKTYIAKNSTSYVITLKTSAGTGVAIPVGSTMLLYCDGTNVVEGLDRVTGAFTVGGTLGVTGAATFSSTVAGAFNGTLGATTPASVAATTLSTTGAATFGGNVAIGLASTNTWSTGYAIEIGTEQAAIWGAGDQIDITGNAYFNSGWKAAATKSGASKYEQALGTHNFAVSGAVTADSAITFKSALNIAPNGDISFYEDTGTTAKFFWDASAESLGIGTSSPTYKLNVLSDAGAQNIFQAGQSGVSNGLSITSDGSALTYSFLTGNVGIGTSSPTAPLTVNGGTASAATIQLGNHNDNASIHGKYSLSFKADSTEAIADRSISFAIGTAANFALTTSTAIFNDLGADIDFRVESDTNTHMLFVDASLDKVNIGASTTSASVLGVYGDASSTHLSHFQSATAGDLNNAAIYISKTDSDTTASQAYIAFVTGGAASGEIVANGASQAAFGAWSDRRLKENIEDLPSQLGNITSLRPVEFDYRDGSGHQIGFIAQELQEVFPDAVSENSDTGMLKVAGWTKNEAIFVKAIQEQQELIKTLEARITALES